MSTFISGVTTARRIAALVLAVGSASQSFADDAHDAYALSPESEAALYADAEARGLGVAYESQGYLRVQDGLNWWYVGRPGSEAAVTSGGAAGFASPSAHASRRPV